MFTLLYTFKPRLRYVCYTMGFNALAGERTKPFEFSMFVLSFFVHFWYESFKARRFLHPHHNVERRLLLKSTLQLTIGLAVQVSSPLLFLTNLRKPTSSPALWIHLHFCQHFDLWCNQYPYLFHLGSNQDGSRSYAPSNLLPVAAHSKNHVHRIGEPFRRREVW